MTHRILAVIYIVAFVPTFFVFGMSRAVLMLSREARVPYYLTSVLLPSWYFRVMWCLRIVLWGDLIIIALTWGWHVALGFFGLDVLAMVIFPIPYRMFIPSFQKKIEMIRLEDPELGGSLDKLLAASGIHDW